MKFLVVLAILAAVATAQPKHHADDRILNIIGGILDLFKPNEPINTEPVILPPYDHPEHPIVVEDPVIVGPALPPVLPGPILPGPALPPALPEPVLPGPGIPEPNPAPVVLPNPLANYSPLVKVIMNIN